MKIKISYISPDQGKKLFWTLQLYSRRLPDKCPVHGFTVPGEGDGLISPSERCWQRYASKSPRKFPVLQGVTLGDTLNITERTGDDEGTLWYGRFRGWKPLWKRFSTMSNKMMLRGTHVVNILPWSFCVVTISDCKSSFHHNAVAHCSERHNTKGKCWWTLQIKFHILDKELHLPSCHLTSPRKIGHTSTQRRQRQWKISLQHLTHFTERSIVFSNKDIKEM